MNTAALTMRAIAEALIPRDVTERSLASAALSLSLRELQPNLLTLMGRGGLRSLAARALISAASDAPALRHVTVNNEGAFVGLDEAGAGLSDGDFRTARIALLTEVFLLLLQFIGPGMTLAVISDSWPDADLESADLSQAGKS